MPRPEYFFQKKKRSFTQRFFGKGLNAASYILFCLKEGGKDFLRELPSSYPQFKLMKEMFGVERRTPPLKKETIRVNLYRLKKLGLIVKEPKQKIWYLTDQGKEFVSYIENRFLTLKKPWDGKLRIVIFDIPEKKKRWREWLREELLLLQYQQLQKSVYVGKTPLPESLYKEIKKLEIGKYVFVFIVVDFDRKDEILELLEQERS